MRDGLRKLRHAAAYLFLFSSPPRAPLSPQVSSFRSPYDGATEVTARCLPLPEQTVNSACASSSWSFLSRCTWPSSGAGATAFFGRRSSLTMVFGHSEGYLDGVCDSERYEVRREGTGLRG